MAAGGGAVLPDAVALGQVSDFTPALELATATRLPIVVETRPFGSRVIYERYRRARHESD